MTTLERLTADLTVSMKARTAFRTNTLRQMIAAVRSAEKSGAVARELTDEQVQNVLSGEVKKRRESAQIYTDAGASERAATETSEADLIESYLPAAVSLEQLDTIVATRVELLVVPADSDLEYEGFVGEVGDLLSLFGCIRLESVSDP